MLTTHAALSPEIPLTTYRTGQSEPRDISGDLATNYKVSSLSKAPLAMLVCESLFADINKSWNLFDPDGTKLPSLRYSVY